MIKFNGKNVKLFKRQPNRKNYKPVSGGCAGFVNPTQVLNDSVRLKTTK